MARLQEGVGGALGVAAVSVLLWGCPDAVAVVAGTGGATASSSESGSSVSTSSTSAASSSSQASTASGAGGSAQASTTSGSGGSLPGLRVFLTDPVFADFGSAAAADALCQAQASAAGLGGAWMSWTSDAATSPSQRFTQSPLPYRLLDGAVVANDWADLTDGSLAHAIDLKVNLAQVGNAEVWTGTFSDGAVYGSDCASWTTQDIGEVGMVGGSGSTDAQWTNLYLQFCNRDNVSLYCFEQ